jgi:hypothetical protein
MTAVVILLVVKNNSNMKGLRPEVVALISKPEPGVLQAGTPTLSTVISTRWLMNIYPHSRIRD